MESRQLRYVTAGTCLALLTATMTATHLLHYSAEGDAIPELAQIARRSVGLCLSGEIRDLDDDIAEKTVVVTALDDERKVLERGIARDRETKRKLAQEIVNDRDTIVRDRETKRKLAQEILELQKQKSDLEAEIAGDASGASG